MLLNKILDEQGLRIGFQGSKEDEGIHETGFRLGNIPVYLKSTVENISAVLNSIYDKHYAIAVTPDEQSQYILAESFPEAKGRIFTVQEAKGLEYEVVFTINVTSVYEKEWRKIIDGNEVKRVRRHRRFFGYIYVAASRARNHLVIIEEKSCSFLKIIDGTYEVLETYDLEKVGLAKQSTADEFDMDANKLDKAGLAEKAEEARKMAKKIRERKESKPIPIAKPESVSLTKKEETTVTEQKVVPLTKRLFLINNNNKQGVVNDNGDVVIECKYDSITYSQYKDKNGKLVFECRINNKITYIDRNDDVFKLQKKRSKRKAVIVAASFLLVLAFSITLIVFNPSKNKQNSKPKQNSGIEPNPISDFIEGDIVQVAAGITHSAALTKDGKVWVWGDNLYDGHTAIYSQYEGVYSVHVTYKGDSNKPVNKKINIDNVSYITTGTKTTAAIKKDGSLWTWGYNYYGALGNGFDHTAPGATLNIDSTPYKILDDVESVSLGDDWGVAVKKDGTLWIWGKDTYGLLEDENAANGTVPIIIMEDVSAASVGADYGMALKKDGSVWRWGISSYDHLFRLYYTVYPEKITENVTHIFAGYMNTSIIKDDGTLWIWKGYESSKQVPIEKTDGVAQVVSGVNVYFVLSKSGKLYKY